MNWEHLDNAVHELQPKGWMKLKTYKEGFLSRLGHDLTLSISPFLLSFQKKDSTLSFELKIPKTSFRVVEPVSMSEKDKKEIATNIVKHLAADLTMKGQLEISSENVFTLRATGGLGKQSADLTFPCRLVGNTLSGQTSFTHKMFGIEPYKAPFGVIKVKEEMDFSFELELPFSTS